MKKTLEEKRQNVAENVGNVVGLVAGVTVGIALNAALPGADKIVGKVVRKIGIACMEGAATYAGAEAGEDIIKRCYKFSDKIKERKVKREDKKNGLEEVEVVA